MTKKKSEIKGIGSYERRLRDAIRQRRGDLPEFVGPQLALTAANWQELDRAKNELAAGALLLTEYGRNGQRKQVLNPLAAQVNALFKTLRFNLQALGLTFDIIPEKVERETNKKKRREEEKEEDTLMQFMRDIEMVNDPFVK